MASRPTPTAAITVAQTPHSPPSARDLRAQTVQRLQTGMLGLAAMLLLVGLANIIMDRARQADGSAAAASPSAAGSQAAPKNDPLADMGVVPSASPSPGAASAAPARSDARN
jgi:hypothetical protein